MAATEPHVRAASAVDELYRRHVGDVYRYTYAVLGNHADAEDVTQTTFVNALRALERGEQPRNAGNWLLAIAHNLVRQRWRQAASRPAEVELVHDVAAGDESDDIELDGLVKALQRIPPAQREAIVMRELEGRSYREISELLSLSTSALETLLFRARRSLAEELENVVTCQTAELAISKRLDGRLGRKERRRLAVHLEECAACSRLADTQTRQRRAFKGLAVLPLPLGLALFKGAPAATAAAGLPTIGGTAAGGILTGSSGTATALGSASVGAGAAGGAGAGGAAAGGTLIGGAAAKVAAVVVAAGVATGVGYEGVKAVRDTPSSPAPARSESGGRPAASGTGAAGRRAAGGASSPRAATPTPPVRAQGAASAPGRVKQEAIRTSVDRTPAVTVETPSSSDPSRGNASAAHEEATPTRRRTGHTRNDDKTAARAAKSKAGANETAAAAKARAAAKKLARDSATGSSAATGNPANGKPASGSAGDAPSANGSLEGKAKGKGSDVASAPPAAPAPDGTSVEPPATTPESETGSTGGPPADAGANGKGQGKR